jgi:tetratricopeptide (TPR) repeat protein
VIAPALLGALLAAVCEVPAPHEPADPQRALAYLEVAQREEASGAGQAAATAYLEALRWDPRNQKAHSAQRRLCARAEADALLEQAIEKIGADDCPAALGLLTAARHRAPSPEAGLLEGVCLYEAGDDEQARAQLLAAAQDPRLAGPAQFYLGLIALRQGLGSDARSRFEAAAADPSLRPAARSLLTLSRRSGRWIVGAELGLGWDSNVDLAGAPTPLPAGSADAAGTVAGSVLWRPLGTDGPYAQGRASYRRQAQLPDWDLGAAAASAGWQHGGGVGRAWAEYALETVAFGGRPHLNSHGPSAQLQLAAGPGGPSLTAAWHGRFETFVQPTFHDWSGFRQSGALHAGWLFTRGALAEVGWQLTRDLARAAELSFLEHGPALRLFVPLTKHSRLVGQAGARARHHDRLDPDFGRLREELSLEGSLATEWEAQDGWTWFLQVDGGQVRSSIAELSHGRFGASAGLRLARGFW